MKDKSKKHDHKGTKILKLSIFASVIHAPLFAIAFKCAYATFNKNAYQSYSDNVSQIITSVTGGTTLDTGLLYTIAYTNGLYTGQTFSVMNGKTNIVDLYFTNQSWTVKTFSASYEENRTRLIVYDTNNIQHNCFNWQDINNTFWFYPNDNQVLDNQQHNYNVYVNTYTKDSLDNAFYYAVDQMKDNDLFAWTKNTALYTPINAMTTGLGITTDAISILLAYWLYITLIYVVFDIVIELFTYLSHLIMGNPIG